MRISIAKGACSIGLAATCAIGLIACSSSGSANSGLVAATVNGVEILEDDITNSIESARSTMGYDTDDTWGEYLVTYGYTPESIREQMIESFIEEELIRQAAAENDITIDSSTIDGYVEQIKAYYDSDEAWQSALESVGMTEEQYRENIETSLMSQELQSIVVSSDEPTEEELMEYASSYASYYDGAKRSSHILFDADDTETAQSVLDQINAGEIDFASAAQEYSQDSSASSGGDVGWDALTTFVDEYQDALDQLSEGEVSGLVTSTYGIHIIMCTEEFTAPDELTSSDELPDEIREELIEYVQEQNLSTDFSEWLTAYEEEADIVINDMPEGLPYDIDLTPYQTEDEDTDETDEETTSTDEDTTDEDTSDETSTDESSSDTASDDDTSETSEDDESSSASSEDTTDTTE